MSEILDYFLNIIKISIFIKDSKIIKYILSTFIIYSLTLNKKRKLKIKICFIIYSIKTLIHILIRKDIYTKMIIYKIFIENQ